MKRKFVRIAVYGICIILGIGIVRSVYTLSQKKWIMVERRQVLTQLTDKNQQLQQELKEATGPAFIEQAARDKLGLVKPGETVVIMDTTRNAESGTQEHPSELPSWKQWWQLFF